MATANIAVLLGQYGGSNTLKIALYREDDPTVEVQAQYVAGPFTRHDLFFPNLIRGVVYLLKRYEVANDNHSIILQDYGDVFRIIANNYIVRYKEPVEWVAGFDRMPDDTIFPAGVSSFSNADWIGWEIEDFTQFSNEMTRNQFTYDSATGTITKTLDDDVFEEDTTYKIRFKPQIEIADNQPTVVANALFTELKIITDNTTLLPEDMGKNILIKGSAPYLKITLPALEDIPALKVTFFEMERSDTARCCEIANAAGDITNWLKGNRNNLYICPSESIELYKEVIGEDLQWRVRNPYGNWLCLGEKVSSDMDAAGVFNSVAMDGSNLDYQQYARLYNDYVLRLPSSQLVDYSAWGTGNNKYKYSRKSTTTGFFRIPDRRNTFARQTDGTRLPGDYQKNAVIDHQHEIPIGTLPNGPFGLGILPRNGMGKYNGYANANSKSDLTGTPFVKVNNIWTYQDASTETRPDNVAERFYVKV